jgi:6-pyruvoyltetrahydropterin/6-carboxytetrahydropterin synthase
MFEVAVEHTFAAAHALRGYRGKCENLHGHNYRVQVVIEGERLNSIGLLYDFKDLKRILREISDRLDHFNLNELPPFEAVNPSAENLARYFHDEVARGIAETSPEVPVRIGFVRVWETETSVATYRPGPDGG